MFDILIFSPYGNSYYKYDFEFEEIKNEIGSKFEILLMRNDREIERFTAILGDPMHYVNNLLRLGYIGALAKISQKSDDFISQAEEKLIQLFQANKEQTS